MRVTARTALLVVAIIASTSAAVAQNGKLTDLPTGDVWISEPGSQAPSGGGNTRAVPAIPPDIVLPDNKDAAPAEFNFNITLMLQRNDKHRVHAGRHRHAAQAAHRSNRLPHNACRG
jgi:hypothetical protein